MPKQIQSQNPLSNPDNTLNYMSELMGNIISIYDAKPEGFAPGGLSLHNMMIPYRLDAQTFDSASNEEMKPQCLDNTLSFMFVSRFLSKFRKKIYDFMAIMGLIRKFQNLSISVQ